MAKSKRYVVCPNCGVQYPEDNLYQSSHDRPEDGRRYTVSCAVCGWQFDVAYRRNWLRRLTVKVQS